MEYPRIWLLITSVLIITAFASYVTATALPSWAVKSNSPSRAGLWKSCTKDAVCTRPASSCSGDVGTDVQECVKLVMSRMFIILACILSGGSVIVLLKISMTGASGSRSIGSARSLANLSFLCGLIATPVGIKWALKESEGKLSLGAYIAIVGTVANLIGAVIAYQIPKGPPRHAISTISVS